MKSSFPVLLSILAAGLLLLPPQASRAQAGISSELSDFSRQLQRCGYATAREVHPSNASLTIRYAVNGERDGRCLYTQNLPGDMRMICAFDASQRTALAEEIASGAHSRRLTSGARGDVPAWASSCELETPDGQRVPMMQR